MNAYHHHHHEAHESTYRFRKILHGVACVSFLAEKEKIRNFNFSLDCIDHSNLELHLVGKILLIKVSIVTQNSLPESTIIVDPKNCICCTSWLVVIHWNPLNFMKIPCTILFQKNFRKSNVPFWQVKAIKIVCVLVLKKPFRLYAFMLSQQSLLSVKALCDLSTGNHQSIIGFQEGIFFVIEQILDSGGPEGNIKLMLNFLPTL